MSLLIESIVFLKTKKRCDNYAAPFFGLSFNTL